MAHYAFLDENNIVTEVIPGVDENELIEGEIPEVWYGKFRGQTCKRTSYNTLGNVHTNGGTPFRGNFAAVGYKYDSTFDAFIPIKVHNSWKLNYETFTWEAQIPMPEPVDGYVWLWSETNLEWIKFKTPYTK